MTELFQPPSSICIRYGVSNNQYFKVLTAARSIRPRPGLPTVHEIMNPKWYYRRPHQQLPSSDQNWFSGFFSISVISIAQTYKIVNLPTENSQVMVSWRIHPRLVVTYRRWNGSRDRTHATVICSCTNRKLFLHCSYICKVRTTSNN